MQRHRNLKHQLQGRKETGYGSEERYFRWHCTSTWEASTIK